MGGAEGSGNNRKPDLTHPAAAEQDFYKEVNTELGFLADGDPTKEEAFENMTVGRFYSHIVLRLLKAQREKELYEESKKES